MILHDAFLYYYWLPPYFLVLSSQVIDGIRPYRQLFHAPDPSTFGSIYSKLTTAKMHRGDAHIRLNILMDIVCSPNPVPSGYLT